MTMHHLLLMGMPNAGELVITLLIIVVLFGGKKIPELAKGLGQGIREFNEAKDGVKEEIEKGMSSATTSKAITQHAEHGVKRDQVAS